MITGFDLRHDGKVIEISEGEAYVAGLPWTIGVAIDLTGAEAGRWHLAISRDATGYLISPGVQQDTVPLWAIDWDGEAITSLHDIRRWAVLYGFARGYPARPTSRQVLALPEGIWYVQRVAMIERRVSEKTREMQWIPTIMSGGGDVDLIFDRPKCIVVNNIRTGGVDCVFAVEYMRQRLTPQK